MLDSHMNSLLDFSVSDNFFKDYSDGSWVDIENLSSSSMVEMMGHSSLLGGVDVDINVVTDFMFLEIALHSNASISSEWSLEFMSSS